MSAGLLLVHKPHFRSAYDFLNAQDGIQLGPFESVREITLNEEQVDEIRKDLERLTHYCHLEIGHTLGVIDLEPATVRQISYKLEELKKCPFPGIYVDDVQEGCRMRTYIPHFRERKRIATVADLVFCPRTLPERLGFAHHFALPLAKAA